MDWLMDETNDTCRVTEIMLLPKLSKLEGVDESP